MLGNRRMRIARKIGNRMFKIYGNSEYADRLRKRGYSNNFILDYEKRTKGVYRKTRVPCSCDMCGNPRRHTGEVSFQEKKQQEQFKDELELLERIGDVKNIHS